MKTKRHTCGHCSTVFERNDSKEHKYCSKTCYIKARFGEKDDTPRYEERACVVCSNAYTVQTNPPSGNPFRKTCSKSCQSKLAHADDTHTKDGRPLKHINGKTHVEVTCEHCGQKAWRPHKSKPHRFCSVSCASQARQHAKGNVPTYITSSCEICQKDFEQRVMPSKPIVRTCSTSCAGKLTALQRGEQLDTREMKVVNGEKYVKVTCERCEKQAWLPHSGNEHRFCSRSCASLTHSEEGVGFASYEKRYAYWERVHGKDEADKRLAEMRRKQSEGVSVSNAKRLITDELRQNVSLGLKKAYAEGRLKPPGFQYRRHPAHGYSFRSRLELCYANELVAQGLKPGVDWEYEPENLRVTYVGPDGEEHTYFPDFRVLGDIVEVKPSSQLDDDFVKAKAEAARLIAEELEASFYFVTEREVPSYKSKAERSAA